MFVCLLSAFPTNATKSEADGRYDVSATLSMGTSGPTENAGTEFTTDVSDQNYNVLKLFQITGKLSSGRKLC